MAEPRKDRCETCRFWDQSGKDHPDWGECRRGHPTLVLSLVAVRECWEDKRLDGGHACWPRSHKWDWCGEWQPVPAPTPEPAPIDDEKHDRPWWRAQGMDSRDVRAIARAVGGGSWLAAGFSLCDVCRLTVRQLCEANNCGRAALKRIVAWLAARGLSLKDE